MRSNVRSPGPAQDGLNKMFAAHLPNLAPRSSFESIRTASGYNNGGGGLENMGGAIEGWVRKMATRASTGLQQASSSGNGMSGADGRPIRDGELIELSEDAFDVAESRMAPTTAGGAGGRTNAITGWTAQEQEAMLHERFPPRGRVFADSSSKNNRGRSR